MKLSRLQEFQRRCLEEKGTITTPMNVTLCELDELVHEIFRLRTVIRAVKDATRETDCETWGDIRAARSGGSTP